MNSEAERRSDGLAVNAASDLHQPRIRIGVRNVEVSTIGIHSHFTASEILWSYQSERAHRLLEVANRFGRFVFSNQK